MTPISEAPKDGTMNINFKIKFVVQDCWIGVYWKTVLTIHNMVRTDLGEEGLDLYQRKRTFYICLIPCLPLIFTITGKPFHKNSFFK